MAASFADRMAELTHELLAKPLAGLLPANTATQLTGKTLGTGLLTPNAQFDSTLIAICAETRAAGLVTSGRVRIDNVEAAASLVPAQVDDAVHLMAIDHLDEGVRVMKSAKGGGARPGWLILTDYVVDPAKLSAPLKWPDSPALMALFDAYAAAMASHIGQSCSIGLQEARRRLAALQSRNGVASQSQLTAHQISKLESEVELVKDAAAFDACAPWPLLCAAEHVRCRFIQLLEELDSELGLDWPWDAVPWPAQADLGQLGGLRSIQGEDARRRRLVA